MPPTGCEYAINQACDEGVLLRHAYRGTRRPLGKDRWTTGVHRSARGTRILPKRKTLAGRTADG